MKGFLISLLLCVFILEGAAHDIKKIIGVKIYQYNKDFKELVETWNDIGINTAFISVELAANKEFRQVLKENGIPAYIISPVFYNPEALKLDSGLYAIINDGRIAKDGWVNFVCPSRKDYRNEQMKRIANTVDELDPEGISIDFIRQFIYWEKVFPEQDSKSINKACFCDSCLDGFSETTKIKLPKEFVHASQKADYILQNYLDLWNDYRTDLIASMIQEIVEEVKRIKPALKTVVHAVPWRDVDFDGANITVAAQDLRKISPLVDHISPMCYSQMLKRDPEWISSVVRDMDGKAKGQVLPSIQVYNYDEHFTEESFKNSIIESLSSPSLGVVFWSWPLIEAEPSKIELIKELLEIKL